MNKGLAKSKFRSELEELLETISRELERKDINPFAGAGDQVFHEHATRIFFFDKLLKLLGWELGAGGNVAEEARIKEETTRFIDYLGIHTECGTPCLIFEAKAWDKPIIHGKGDSRRLDKKELVTAAVQHLYIGGKKEDSPVAGEWYEYLSQLGGYVRTAKKQGYSVPRAVLSSGRWLLIFKAPADAFCDGKLDDDSFIFLEQEEYVVEAHQIFEQLAREVLAPSPPETIHPTQLPTYVTRDIYKASYHAMLIVYEKTCVEYYTLSPRILLYPSLIVETKNKIVLTVIDDKKPILFPLLHSDDENMIFHDHFAALEQRAQELLNKCSIALNINIATSPLLELTCFHGKSRPEDNEESWDRLQGTLFRPMRRASNQWRAVMGQHTHVLLKTPMIPCRFHEWSECRDCGCAMGASAVTVQTTEHPRSVFIDAAPHHCANRAIIDRRENRCILAPIDSRTCCKACVYHDLCWSADEIPTLPCGT